MVMYGCKAKSLHRAQVQVARAAVAVHLPHLKEANKTNWAANPIHLTKNPRSLIQYMQLRRVKLARLISSRYSWPEMKFSSCLRTPSWTSSSPVGSSVSFPQTTPIASAAYSKFSKRRSLMKSSKTRRRLSGQGSYFSVPWVANVK